MNNTIVCRIINARLCHCENIKRILLSCSIIQRPILSILYHSIGDIDRQGTNELSSMLTPRKSNNVASARWTARIVIIARPAASRRIIWQANRWKKMQPLCGKIRGKGQSISIAGDTIMFNRWTIERNCMGWEWPASSFRTEKAHPVPCQLTVGNVPSPRTATRTITRTHAFFGHHRIAY